MKSKEADYKKPVTKDTKFSINVAGKKLNVLYLVTPAVIEKAISELTKSNNKVFGFDLETGKKNGYENDAQAGLDPDLSFISLIQLYDGVDRVFAFDIHGVTGKERNSLLDMFCNLFCNVRLVAHNAIFDAHHWLHATGQELNIDCTMIMYNLVRAAEYADMEEEERSITKEWGEEGDGTALDFLAKYERYGASLRAVVAKTLGISIEKELQLSDWTNRPLERDQIIYAAKDSYLTHAVGRILSRKIMDLGLSKVYALNREAIHPVVAMIRNGLRINTKEHKQRCIEWAKQKDILLVQVLKHFGSATNIRSTVQVSRWLEKNLPLHIQHRWARSEKSGRLKSDAHTLQGFNELEFVKPLLEYKKLDKMLSTYGIPLLKKISPVDSRLHGSFTLGYTATGRLSSRSPNLQNLPRNTDVKGVFIAGRNNVLIGADYSTIELRVAAELSRDPVMLGKIQAGIDLHRFLVSTILKKPIDSITKPQRQLGKALNFGLLYGLGAKGLVDYARWNYDIRLTKDQAAEYVYIFFDTYKGYARWQQKQRNYFQIHGTVHTQFGKVRRLKPAGAYTRSVNHPVQGSAAEVVIVALNRLHSVLPRNMKLINCVHDEIILEASDTPHDIEHATGYLKKEMEAAYLDIFPRASLVNLVEVKVGHSWADLK